MVAVAAKRVGADAQVSTAVFDQSAIEFGDASFDAVINRHGLMFVEDPAQTVAEAVRVLRAGGRYAVMTWDRREANPWLGLVLDAVSAQFGVPFPPPNVRGPFSLDTRGVLVSVLRDGGLEDVTVEAMPTPMRAASLGEWWERVPKLAGPLALALAGMEADVRDAIGERAMQTAANAAASEVDGIVFEGSVLIGSGHKAAV
jgi:SAM-dependent methyltransferase